MTKEAIIEELKKLSPQEQREVVEAIRGSIEEGYELSNSELALVDQRWKEMQEHPDHNLSYDELRERVDGASQG